MTINSNSGTVAITANQVTGSMTVNANHTNDPVVIGGNAISGSLACASNVPAPVSGGVLNTVSGSVSGQCATLVKVK
ncbi:MAG: hypothetical protein JO147_07235 [Actinobacteria bacterium]|nr:hypothetical protein [Actinomycetota bacterium]